MLPSPTICRILDLLDRDARASADQLARKLRLSGDVVLYHLAKLQENGIVNHCSAVIDFSKLGLILFRISVKITRNSKFSTLSDKLLQVPHTTLVVDTRGEHDLIVWGLAPNLHTIQRCYSQCQGIVGKLARKSSLELITETNAYSRGFLVNRPGKIFSSRGSSSKIKLDKLDLEILQSLRIHARRPLTQLAKILETTPTVVSYRIRKLEQAGVILGYRVNLNSEKIGLQRFRAQLSLDIDYEDCAQALRDFCEKTTAITRLEFQIGSWSAEVEIETESFATLHEILDQLKVLLSGSIQILGIVLFRRAQYSVDKKLFNSSEHSDS